MSSFTFNTPQAAANTSGIAFGGLNTSGIGALGAPQAAPQAGAPPGMNNHNKSSQPIQNIYDKYSE